MRGRRRSRAETAQLVAEFEASGMTRVEFSRRHGIAVSTLDGYRKRQRRTGASASSTSRLLEVEVAGPQRETETENRLTVVLCCGRRIEVGNGFDAAILRRLVSLLEQV